MLRTDQTTSDEELARQAQAGSVDCFEALVLRYENRVYGFLCQRTPSPDDARDLTQDTFIKAWKNLGKFRPHRRFAPWLFTMASRLAISAYRSRRETQGLDWEIPDERDPAGKLGRTDAVQNMWCVAKDALTDRQFAALWLQVDSDMTVKEIARVLGVTGTHAKVILYRARKGLVRALERKGDVLASIRDVKHDRPATPVTLAPVASCGPYQGGVP